MFVAAERISVVPICLVLLGTTGESIASPPEARGVSGYGQAPQFQAHNQDGRLWESVDHVRMQYVVVFFYKGDFRCGCVQQVRNYRDNLKAFAEENAVVVGVSGDSHRTHRMFTDLHSINVTLLSDENGRIATSFGVPFRSGGKARVKDLNDHEVYPDGSNRRSLIVRRGVTTERRTFVIGRDGTVIYKNAGADPAKDAEQVLLFIRNWKRKGAR